MNTTATRLILAGLMLAGASQVTFAGTATPGIDYREHNQSVRIYHGIRNGNLTRQESGRLISQQHRISRLERNFKSDGRVTRGERFILHSQLNRSSRSIFRRKHNNLHR